MPMNRRNTRGFTRKLFAGTLERLQLLKRGDDQKQNEVRDITLYQCRRSAISKSGQTVLGDNVVSHQCVWHIPRRELDRVGVEYLNNLDRLVQLDEPEKGGVWEPESTTRIDVKMFANEVDVLCLRTDGG